ncbi:acetate--CoA ligase [Serratia marcescens]|nr:acetate--CoA ligase [Serratia marcescens]RTF71485.1 acetate--CoA ligase [Serratia marcescens]RTF90881.1 acetate--CoA ligase [Serratia marcescens]RTG22315.1 acetate--CoA ligase [Serratia marcescens]RTG42202.1 acetate--CoA ligase [Serratia marcescens]
MSETLSLPDTQVEYRDYPLVAAQPGIWIADQIALRRNSFAVAHYTELHGAIDRSALERAIRQGLAEADTVQARFIEAQDGQPVQRLPLIADPARVQAPEWFDFSARPDAEQAALALMNDDLAQDLPADGERPLYRHAVIRVSADRWFWYQRFHHLTLDGFSFEAITRRIADIYRALRHGLSPAASPFTPFGKVVEEFQQWQTSPARRRAAEFWQQHLRDLPSPLSLSTESREVEPGARPLKQALVLPESLFDEALQSLQPADIVTAALAMYLARMSGETRFSLGFPFMRRMGSQALAAVGPVVNVLPLLLNVTPEMSLADVCQATVAQIKQARRHQRYEAEQIKRDLGLVGGHQELYGPVINVKVYHSALSFDGQAAVTHTLAMGPVDDLEFEIGFRNGVLTLSLVANPAKYSPRTLHHHAERIGHWLQQLARQPHQPNGQLALIGEGELKQLAAWGRGAHLTPPAGMVSIMDAFQRQVERQPEALAVACGDVRLSYRQLSERVMQLGRVLIESGIGAEDVVAIGIPRSVDTLVALFGVLASGAAYMPLDLDYPRERLALMCDDARPAMLLTHRATQANMPDLPQVLCLDDAACLARCAAAEAAPITDAERRAPLNEAHLAYMIYTSGSTGKPKGVLHTTGGYLVYAAMTFKYVFDYHDGDIYWCTADVGWVTGHSYLLYGPLACGATTLMFEGVPNYPGVNRLSQVIDKHQVNILYTAPTAIRALMAEGDKAIEGTRRDSLRIMGSVGEPINPEAWEWYYNKIGNARCPIVDTWWQTETGGFMITPLPGATELKAGSATRPFFGVQPALVDNVGTPQEGACEGNLVIVDSWPGQARTLFGDHDRFEQTYFSTFKGMYFSGDGARRDEDGYYWITGRVDDVLNVSGHRLGTAEIESALVSHPKIAEAAVVGIPHNIKGQAIYAYITLNHGEEPTPELYTEVRNWVRKEIGPIATPDVLHWTDSLPKTRSGKIMRRILRKIAAGDTSNLGDTSTLADPAVVDKLLEEKQSMKVPS